MQRFNYYKSKYNLQNIYSIEEDQIFNRREDLVDQFIVIIDQNAQTRLFYYPIKEATDITEKLLNQLDFTNI